MTLIISNGAPPKELEIGGSVILYTPIGWGAYQKFRRDCRDMATLIVDEQRVDDLVLAAHVKGWRGVEDNDGNEVEFSLDLLNTLALATVQIIFSAIIRQVVQENEQQGNSDGSSNT